MKKITELLEDGTDAGFVWELGEVQYEPNKGQKVSLGEAPHATVADVTKFEENFPGVILAALNGTSIKVACQAVTRRMLVKVKADGGKRPSDEEMKAAVLNALRGIKNRATVIERKVFTFDGVEYATLEEAQTAEKAKRIADLIDLGVDPEVARAKVMQTA